MRMTLVTGGVYLWRLAESEQGVDLCKGDDEPDADEVTEAIKGDARRNARTER